MLGKMKRTYMGGFKLRRKQLYAIILAGALSVGSTSATVMAAEDTTAETTESTETQTEETQSSATESTDTAASETEAQATEAPAAETSESTSTDTSAADTAQSTSTDETAQAASTENTEAQEATPTPETTAAASYTGESDTETSIALTLYDGDNGTEMVHYFNDLQSAVDAATSVTAADTSENKNSTVYEIKVSGDITLSKAVTIPADTNIKITATKAVTIKRGAAYAGSLFEVSGSHAELSLAADTTDTQASLTLDGAVDSTITADKTNTLISVSDSGIVALMSGVTIQNNNTSADEGAAITNKGGNILLLGGTVTGNTGKNGAIYSDAGVCVQGDVNVTNNKNTDSKTANVYVDLGDADSDNVTVDTAITVIGKITGTGIGFTDANPSDGKEVVAKGTDGTTEVSEDDFKEAVNNKIISDDSTNYSVVLSDAGDAGIFKSKAATAFTVEVTQEAKWKGHSYVDAKVKVSAGCQYYFKVVKTSDVSTKYTTFDETLSTKSEKAKTFIPKSTISKDGDYSFIFWAKPLDGGEAVRTVIDLKNRPAATVKVTVTLSQADKWKSHEKLDSIKFKVSGDNCKWYCSTSQVEDKNKFDNTIKNGDTVTINQSDIVGASSGDFPDDVSTVYLFVKSTTDGTVKKSKITFKNRPAKASVTTTVTARAAHTYSVDENTVSGLDEEIKFFPGKVVNFEVSSKGSDISNDEAVTGDEKYVYLGWSKSKTYDKDSLQANSTSMSSAKGISKSGTGSLYFWFQKYVWNGKEWVASGDPEAKKVKFHSAGYTDEELANYYAELSGTPTASSGDGTYTEAELTATAAAEAKSSGSTSKKAASTADESPIGSMSALAALSLLAGGYIIVRKRKKEEI